eukprot:CAMPEP_0118707380 /NCGR_PEP_ID=MMETSP0800-20121206/21174_1 /TAXON_ID=210618 ORGANISM="Striatella unipunctata, Strain CCMP2910" /NCGR_SAMPLE_ID=MMETSP0800 /ASSEMBLY_ACC=CAM_ASM_000638 /LENGTH=56 /DNA_ID=CAMNT_0006610205 /DNA_START=28 /DNA_END=194 /DNA_ORIENTATION=+
MNERNAALPEEWNNALLGSSDREEDVVRKRRLTDDTAVEPGQKSDFGNNWRKLTET